MKKGCVTYKKNSRNSELSLRNLFISQQIIDKYSNILDFTSFQTEVSKHTENAKKIGVDKGNLFTQKTIMTNEKSYYQASPNKEAFMAIDMVNDGKSNIKTFDKELAQKIQDKLEKLYPEIKLNITNNPIWEKGKNIFNQEDYDNQINFRLKAVETLLSDKAKQVFEKGERAKWDLNKILTELAIPKEQKQIILDLGKTNIEDITTSLLSSYSYTVEINTAKDKVIEGGYISTLGSKVSSMENRYGKYYYTDERGVEIQIDKTSWETAKQIFDEFQKGSNKGVPTQYHSNLTVPGGTNYKENEIATPDITPSIKGHAQFATDKGIGWFRSDDKENKAVGWKEEDDFLNSETAQYNPITKDDKIIFGHPTIGKSYLKQKGNNDFITLDDDYKDEVNAFVDANRGSETRQEYKGRKTKDYNEFMLNLFDRLKVQAKKEGKRLFVSNTNILKERMSEFDKVITIPKDEFKKRFDARGATYGFEDWKSDIDTTVAKVDKSKVISTTGYLSDLLEGNPKTRRILEVQSDLFQKGRDKEVLIKGSEQETNSTQEFFTVNNVDYQYSALDGYEKWDYKSKKEEWIPISYEEFNEAYLKIKDIDKNNNSNKFLQLLNKSNNWVTFFVKSIIQDSAKKGYEKVLFPSGETAAKVEGQETLAEELLRINKEIEKNKFTINKRLKEESDLILRIENNIKNNNYLTVEKLGYKIINDPSSVNPTPPKVAALINKKTGEFVNISRGYSNPVFANEKNAEESFNAFIKGNKIVDLNNKSIELKDILNINDLNDDLSLLESKEQRLFNIKNNSLIARELRELEEEKANIKSQGLEKIKPIEAFYENTIANILKKQGYSPKVITDEYGNTWNEVAILPKQLNNILLQRNEANKIIGQANIKAMSVLVDAINQKQDTLPHEYAHHYISWFRDTPIVQEGIKRWGSEEALVQSIGEQVVERKGEALAWWKNFIKWIMNEFSSLSELKRDEITKVLTDAFLTRENLNTAQKQQQVKPVQKGPTKSNESGQMKMFQLKEAENKRKQMTEEAKQLLYQYAKINGIKIEYVDQVLDDNGNDIVSFYDNVKKVIKINKNLADDSTLPEELGHHLSLALGLDHVLIKRALNLIGRLDYKNLLGQDYVDSYENNTDLLKLEYLGKLISKQISNPKLPDELKSENGVKVWETIKNAVKAFIKLFRGNNNLEQELDNVVNELSSMINSGKNVNNNGDGGLSVKMWQIKNNVSGSKTDKKSKLVSQEYRSQYIYFKRRIVELERKNSKIRSEASKTNSDYRNNVVFLRNASDIAKIESALIQAVNENNQLELMELSYEIINNIKQTIVKFGETNNPDLSKLDKTLEVLNLFSNYGPVKTDVYELKKSINKYLVAYAQKAAVSLIGKNVPKEVFEKEFIDTDINFLEKGFGTLASVQNYVAKTAGLLIKKYQAIEEQENRASYEKISAAVEKLTKYAKTNGIPLKNMYDIFIQNFKNTTVLTKEFNSDFYNLIQKIYEDKSKDPNTAIKKIATYDANRPAGDRWVPKNRTLYDNKEYRQIRSTPELWEFYNFFKDTMKDLNDNSIPIVALNENFIPNMREKTLTSIFKSDDSFQEKFKGSISNILGLDPFSNDESKDYLFDSDLMKNQIPLKYLASISADSKSKNLGEILLRFSYFANSYKNMNEVLPQVNLLKEIVDNQEFIKSNNDNSVTSGANTNTGAIVQAFIDMQVLGKKKNTDTFKIGDTTVPAGAIIDYMMKYTSLLRIGLNPFNAVSNVAIGNVSNIIEAVGGRHFGVGGYMKALGTYTKDFASSKSKTNMLSKIFNPLIEMDDYENLAKLKLGSQEWYSFVTNKERLENLMYAPQRHGERQLQTSTMIAIFRKQKLTTKSGESISMWEAFDENGVWNESLMGYKLSNDEIFKMTSKIHAVNKMIHGRYSAKDAAALTQNAYFRAVFQFKKWIPAAIEARIGGKRSDNILGDTEGRYHTLGRKVLGKLIPGKEFNPFVALYNLAMPLIASEKLIKSGKFTETDVYNMRKNMAELIIIAAIMLFKAGFDDDDKKKKASYKYTMRILSQLSKDITYFYDPQEGLNLLGSGAPILKTAGDIRKMLWTIPAIWTDDDEINRGRHKDEDPFYAAATDILPLYKPFADFGRLWNESSYQEIK